LLRLTWRVFIGAEIRLEVGFNAAQARMANLARGGLLRRASDAAYHELGTGLARVGPLGSAPGMSRLVEVRFSDLALREDSATWAVRWEAAGRGGALFPALDADITLTPAGEQATTLTVTGVYRPPLGGLGAGLDRAIMHRVAQATIRTFTHHIGSALAHPAAAPDMAHARVLPELPPRPSPA
jgi:carbon monoxide dehydrogenase subunit G